MRKLFSIIIVCVLSLPIFAENVLEANEPYNANEAAESTVQENTQNEDTVKEPELPNTQVTAASQFKQPISKKKLAKKFILAMLCVAGTSVFLIASTSLIKPVLSAANPVNIRQSAHFFSLIPNFFNIFRFFR